MTALQSVEITVLIVFWKGESNDCSTVAPVPVYTLVNSSCPLLSCGRTIMKLTTTTVLGNVLPSGPAEFLSLLT